MVWTWCTECLINVGPKYIKMGINPAQKERKTRKVMIRRVEEAMASRNLRKKIGKIMEASLWEMEPAVNNCIYIIKLNIWTIIMFFPTAQKLMHVFESNPIVHIQRAVIIVLILWFSNIKSSFCEQNYQSETKRYNWCIFNFTYLFWI